MSRLGLYNSYFFLRLVLVSSRGCVSCCRKKTVAMVCWVNLRAVSQRTSGLVLACCWLAVMLQLAPDLRLLAPVISSTNESTVGQLAWLQAIAVSKLSVSLSLVNVWVCAYRRPTAHCCDSAIRYAVLQFSLLVSGIRDLLLCWPNTNCRIIHLYLDFCFPVPAGTLGLDNKDYPLTVLQSPATDLASSDV